MPLYIQVCEPCVQLNRSMEGKQSRVHRMRSQIGRFGAQTVQDESSSCPLLMRKIPGDENVWMAVMGTGAGFSPRTFTSTVVETRP